MLRMQGATSVAESEVLQILAAGSEDHLVRLFNQFVLAASVKLEGHRDAVVSVEFIQIPFSPGPILLSLSADVVKYSTLQYHFRHVITHSSPIFIYILGNTCLGSGYLCLSSIGLHLVSDQTTNQIQNARIRSASYFHPSTQISKIGKKLSDCRSESGGIHSCYILQ